MEPFVGQIMPVGFGFAPRGWALCEGQLLQISSHTALFSLLGTTYGGDGRTTFGLPDLRGRTSLGVGSGPGLTPRTWGQKGGSETTSLTANNMPSHNHVASLHARGEDATSSKPGGNLLGGTGGTHIYEPGTQDATMSAESISMTNTGGGQSFNPMPPFLVLYWCIALIGVYPSRN